MSNFRKLVYYTVGSPLNEVHSIECGDLANPRRWVEAQELVEEGLYIEKFAATKFPVMVYLFECVDDIPEKPLHQFEVLMELVPSYTAYRVAGFKGKYDD